MAARTPGASTCGDISPLWRYFAINRLHCIFRFVKPSPLAFLCVIDSASPIRRMTPAHWGACRLKYNR